MPKTEVEKIAIVAVILIIAVAGVSYYAYSRTSNSASSITLCAISTSSGTRGGGGILCTTSVSLSSITIPATTGPTTTPQSTPQSTTSSGATVWVVDFTESLVLSSSSGPPISLTIDQSGFIVIHVYSNSTVSGNGGMGSEMFSGTSTTSSGTCTSKGQGSFGFSAFGGYEAPIGNVSFGFVNLNPETIPYTWTCPTGSTAGQAPVILEPAALTMKLANDVVVNGTLPYGTASGSGIVTYSWKLLFCPNGLCPLEP